MAFKTIYYQNLSNDKACGSSFAVSPMTKHDPNEESAGGWGWNCLGMTCQIAYVYNLTGAEKSTTGSLKRQPFPNLNVSFLKTLCQIEET
jgi:hypothetical protein